LGLRVDRLSRRIPGLALPGSGAADNRQHFRDALRAFFVNARDEVHDVAVNHMQERAVTTAVQLKPVTPAFPLPDNRTTG
jgi:hypothetical protein